MLLGDGRLCMSYYGGGSDVNMISLSASLHNTMAFSPLMPQDTTFHRLRDLADVGILVNALHSTTLKLTPNS
jgi:hypothetical protein